MASHYNWKRRWILQGMRETQETNLSALAQRWFPVGHQSDTNSFSLDDLAGIPVIIMLGEPGIGKTSEIADYFKRVGRVDDKQIWTLMDYPRHDFSEFFERSQFRTWHEGQSSSATNGFCRIGSCMAF